MPIDAQAAADFVWRTARLVDRHRYLFLFEDASPDPLVAALRAYRNADGGFGHALEPDQRAPSSQPVATLYALELLAEAGVDPSSELVTGALDFLGTIANDDGAIPFAVEGTYEAYPHAPWFADPTTTMLTPGIAAAALRCGVTRHPWLDRATAWSWASLDEPAGGYGTLHQLAFLDAAPDADRAADALERLRPILADGRIAVAEGQDEEALDALHLSPRPGSRSRAIIDQHHVDAALDDLEAGQRDDGGWDFAFLHWCPAQELDWRARSTVDALLHLRGAGRSD